MDVSIGEVILVSPNNVSPLDKAGVSLSLRSASFFFPFFFFACALHFCHALQQNTISPKNPQKKKNTLTATIS